MRRRFDWGCRKICIAHDAKEIESIEKIYKACVRTVNDRYPACFDIGDNLNVR